jgi:hypothetical protein
MRKIGKGKRKKEERKDRKKPSSPFPSRHRVRRREASGRRAVTFLQIRGDP